MSDAPAPSFDLSLLQRRGALVGVVLLAGCGLAAFANLTAFLQGWLVAFVFWWQIAVGGMALALLHQLVTGRWGLVSTRIFEAMARTMPLIALLFVPVLLGAGWIYPWADAEYFAEHAELEQKAQYLNVTGFVIRSLVYLGIWTALGFAVSALVRRQDSAEVNGPRITLSRLGAAGLLLYVLTVSFAAIDWGMSLEPEWYSTLYGGLHLVGSAVGGLAFGVAALSQVANRKPLPRYLSADAWNDLGNLLLGFTMVWAYFAFSQFLIVWSADLPVESSWYHRRMAGVWGLLAVVLLVFHFFVPFFALLSRPLKRDGFQLGRVAAGLFAVHFLDVLWTIAPSFSSPVGGWLSVPLVIGMGGVWCAAFLWNLERRPLVPEKDPAADRHRERLAREQEERGSEFATETPATVSAEGTGD